MFIFSNLLIAVARIIDIALGVFYWIIIARAILSWVSPDPFNPIVRFIHNVTEPVLEPIRRILMRFIPVMGIDLSPLAVFLVIIFLQSFLVRTLFDIAISLR